MKVTRRTFLKGSAAAGGGLVASRFLYGPLETLVAESPGASSLPEEKWLPTTCWIGKQECSILARVVDGRVVKLEGNPAAPRNRGTLCPKGMAQIISLYDYNRVKSPLIRTNEKGVPGRWRKATWDEALTLVGEKIKEARSRDPQLVVWQKGRSKAKAFYDKAFVHASGATKLHHGGFCSDAGYRACEYTIGRHGVLHPDFRYTQYLISLGWNLTNAGGNKLCQITWHQQFVQARERGMKLVVLDPSRRGTGPFADEWIPIKPSTDMAFFLAVANVLVAEGYIDQDYLLNYTNAPFLVQGDGYFLRVGGTEQVWDTASGRAVAADTPGIKPALDGEYTVRGQRVKTAFQLFKEHVAQYSPERASAICDIPAQTIRKIARELGENARIGSTITVYGVQVPHRPVAVMAYHVAQQELGFQMIRSALLVMMLLGAVGAAGGQRVNLGGWKVDKRFKQWDEVEIGDPPYNLYLKNSKFFPINSNNSSLVAHVMLDPQRWGVESLPEVLIIHMTNPLLSFPDQKALKESYKKFKFIAVIDPWLSETADLFADVVLPASTLEKYEGPNGVTDQYEDAVAIRMPIMKSLFDSRGDIEIYLDLCEKADILYGEHGYIQEVNKALGLEDTPYRLDVNTKPTVRDIFDRWAKAQGLKDGIRFFETNGLWVKGKIPAAKYYGYTQDPPFGGIRHRLYGEALKRYRDVMEQQGVPEWYRRQYTPFPTWVTPAMEGSPRDYDLYLISRKKIEFKQSRATFIPLLHELAPHQALEINPRTAKERGIADGDEVWVESHNAVTGETRRIKTRAEYRETIRPDTVSMSHHYGFWVNPVTKENGPTPNTIFYSGEGYVSNTADQSFQVKVKVYKA